MARISVFGLGYVGTVSMAVLAKGGHDVVGNDVNVAKVAQVTSGQSPIIERGVPDLLRAGVENSRIHATTDASVAMEGCDIALMCVGTPSQPDGSVDLSQVRKASQQIGSGLAGARTPCTVVVRSTMLPGTTERIVLPALETASGLAVGRDFRLAYNPEFLREGNSVSDFYDPPFTLVGTDDDAVGDVLRDMYAMVDAPLHIVPIEAAEMVKYVSNAYHTLKVVFANEIGDLCRRQNIDGDLVMDLFLRDKKLNISGAYLRPGFAFGGPCLPKDLRALVDRARQLQLDTPVLESIAMSNRRQVERAVGQVTDTGLGRVGILGLSFKPGTGDLRESPLVALAAQLIDEGLAVQVFDESLSLADLHSANLAHILEVIPDIAERITGTLDQLVSGCEVVVVGQRNPRFAEVGELLHPGTTLIDLVGLIQPRGSVSIAPL